MRNQNIWLEQLFKQMYTPLYFYALKFIPNSEAAKDIVQDSFCAIAKKEESEIKDIKSFLFRTTQNNCLNYLNRLKVRNKYIADEIEQATRELKYYDTHQTYVEKEMHEKIHQAIEELPEKYKVPFNLSRFDELKNKEIAEKLELPLRTVETRIYRAMLLLKEKFESSSLFLFSVFKKTTNILT